MSIATEIERLQNAKANIKTAIENKGVTVGDGTIDTYAAKIGEISGGGGLEIERYAIILQLTSLNTLGKSEAVLNLDNVTRLERLCAIIDATSSVAAAKANTTVEHLTINAPLATYSCTNMLNCNNYAPDRKLKHLTFNVDTQGVSWFEYAFNNLQALEIIDGIPLDLTNAQSIDRMFQAVKSLVEVRFKGEIKKSISFSYSPNLSTDTIQSIIDGLADLTGSTTQTLTLHATVGENLTQTQRDAITAKNWTLAY